MLAKTELTEARQVLLRAAEIIERDGWYGGVLRGWCPNHSKCLTMAISHVIVDRRDKGEVTFKPKVYNEAYDLLAKYIKVDNIDYIPEWNDSHTEEQCLEALRNAAYMGV
jgi:hypothetical protein